MKISGLVCKKCGKRERDPFNNIEGLCVHCKLRRLRKKLDDGYWNLARSFSGVLKGERR